MYCLVPFLATICVLSEEKMTVADCSKNTFDPFRKSWWRRQSQKLN